jgi:hypothetical protein
MNMAVAVEPVARATSILPSVFSALKMLTVFMAPLSGVRFHRIVSRSSTK